MKITIRCDTCNIEAIIDDVEHDYVLNAQRFALNHAEHEMYAVGMKELYTAARVWIEETRKLNEAMRPAYDALIEVFREIGASKEDAE
jgi:hypothetical protein